MKTNRIFFWMLGGLAVLSALQGLQAQTPGLSYPVLLDEAHFPDEVFRDYCMMFYDENGDGQLSVEECGAVNEINIGYYDVTSLEGIEYFYALTNLDCGSNQLTSLDVSKNTALTVLYCYGNQLTSLDVSKNTALTDLSCSGNQLTSLDVSKNTALTVLYCYGNQLTSLDVSKNTALTDLSCYGNQLTSLDVSKNTALTGLDCNNNQLTSLDVSRNTALTGLYCSGNQLTSLDLSWNTALTNLDCGSNQLTSLDVSRNTALTGLDCGSNQLTSLDLSRNTALTGLDCGSNQLTSLDVSRNTALTVLYCYDNELTSLDLSQNTDLRWLDCFDNHLAALDLSQNGSLLYVYAEGNYHEVSLDEDGNVDIAAIPGLEADRMRDLQGGYIEGSTLHLDADVLMYYYDYKCPSQDAPSGGYFYIATDNPAYHVPIDKEHFPDTAFRGYVTASFDWDKDGQLSSVEIGIVTDINVSNREIRDLRGIEHFTFLQTLDCSNNVLTSLDVSRNTALETLRCSDNELTSLDVSSCTALETLYCYDNQLTSLNLSRNTDLTDLGCYNNLLTSLDLSQNTDLRWLDCSDNHLAALDLSQNSRLEDVNAERNYYEVSLDESGNVDIAAIPGLEADRMTDLQGGYIEGNTLHLDADILMYYYDYKRPNYYAPSGGYFYIATDNPTYHVPIDKEHFPDSAFRGYVATSFDRNEDGQLSPVEIRIVSDISVPDREIHDLRGIEHFTFLQSLDCSANNLMSLDLSKNTALTTLWCYDNQLTSLDVSKNTALTTLYCSNNQLTSLDLSKNTALYNLDCSYNHLAALDLSKNSSLRTVYAENNYYEVTLDEDGNVDIAAIPGLEADRMTDLQGGRIEGNTLHLDANVLRYYYDYKCPSQNAPSGGYFYISTDDHVPIDKEHFPDTAFRSYVAASFDRDEDGQLSSVEIRIVSDISVPDREIHDLRGIEHFTFLQSLDCSANNLMSLDLSRNTVLQTLDCSDNALLDLDVRSLLALKELDCSKNQLASLDLFRNANLVSVKADGNYREVLVNQDRQFDISTLPRFERARMEAIEGGSLQGDILTFQQDDVRYFYSYNNAGPNLPLGEYFHLKAVQAPVPGIAINDTTFPDAVFRGYIAENADTDKDSLLSESEIAGVTGLDVSGMGIQDLRGIGYLAALQSLDCSDNQLTSLDLSANTALQTLNAGGNRLDIVLDEDNAFDVSILPGFNMAKASDWTGCTRTGNKLTFTQQEVTYAYATGYSGSAEDASLQSVVFSLLADRDPSIDPNPDPDPDPDPDVANEDADAFQGRVYAKDRTLFTEGISGEVSVYTAVGTLVYKGYATEIPVPASGVYIVRNSSQAWKILVM